MVVFDFSKKTTADSYERIYKESLADLDVAILVNNVGMMYTGELWTLTDEDVHNMITANTYPVVLFTKAVLASFKRRYAQHKQRSLVVNVSSMGGRAPYPSMQVYAATKAFVDGAS